MNIGKFLQKLPFITSFPSWCDCSRKKRHKYKNKLTHDVYGRYTRSHPMTLGPVVRVKCWQLIFQQMSRPFTQSRRKGCVTTFVSERLLDILLRRTWDILQPCLWYFTPKPHQSKDTEQREPQRAKRLRPKKLCISVDLLILEHFTP